jgi:hypothetical protein
VNHSCYYEIYAVPSVGDVRDSFLSYFGDELNKRAEKSLGAWKLEELHQSEQDIYDRIKRVEISQVESHQSYLEGFFQKMVF